LARAKYWIQKDDESFEDDDRDITNMVFKNPPPFSPIIGKNIETDDDIKQKQALAKKEEQRLQEQNEIFQKDF
jgi:hypothetical protein